jgi:hypothetical protein
MNATASSVICYDRYRVRVVFEIRSDCMGLFTDFMRKMIEGKPVFEDKSKNTDALAGYETAAQSSETPTVSGDVESTEDGKGSTIVKHQEDTFPVIEVRRVKTHDDGTNVQIYCQLQNTWHEELLIDKIRLLGTKLELDYQLRAGDVRDFLVYKGPRLRHEDKHAEIDYCTSRDKDYFRAEFLVKYTYNAEDSTYTMDEMTLDEPIRDIYE